MKDTTDDVITRTDIQNTGATTRAWAIAIRILGIAMAIHTETITGTATDTATGGHLI